MSDIVPTPPASAQPQTPVAAPAPTIPPGWYPDPSRPGAQRWWTGRDWGSQVAAAPLAAPAQIVRPQTIIVAGKKPVNHAFHLMMTLLTLGLWIPVWIVVAIAS